MFLGCLCFVGQIDGVASKTLGKPGKGWSKLYPIVRLLSTSILIQIENTLDMLGISYWFDREGAHGATKEALDFNAGFVVVMLRNRNAAIPLHLKMRKFAPMIACQALSTASLAINF